MFGRIRNFFSHVAGRIKAQFGRRKSVPDKAASRQEDTSRRIRLVLSQLEPVRRRPRKKLFKVESLADVLRFMFRLCEVENMECKMVGGRMQCKFRLPDNAGTLCLTEKYADHGRRTLAVLKLDIPLMNPQVEEVVFRLKQH